ncbi:C2-domain-containing protein [Neoconidiobolus thromboides FSU 785]|nr:C2-domain-containing protein [Neoconidiobolus thromboides FSU 785]
MYKRIQITIKEARNLTNQDGLFGKNDAYISIKIGGKEQRTKVLKNAGGNATWNEVLQFEANENDEIDVQVKDHDTIKDDLIGSIQIPVLGIFHIGQIENWYTISLGSKNSGEVLLHLKAH